MLKQLLILVLNISYFGGGGSSAASDMLLRQEEEEKEELEKKRAGILKLGEGYSSLNVMLQDPFQNLGKKEKSWWDR